MSLLKTLLDARVCEPQPRVAARVQYSIDWLVRFSASASARMPDGSVDFFTDDTSG